MEDTAMQLKGQSKGKMFVNHLCEQLHGIKIYKNPKLNNMKTNSTIKYIHNI